MAVQVADIQAGRQQPFTQAAQMAFYQARGKWPFGPELAGQAALEQLCLHLQRAQGFEVAGDLAVLGFGNLGFSADVQPALTTVHIDGAAIGTQAARFMIDRTEGRDPGAKVRDIGFSIVPRDSA